MSSKIKIINFSKTFSGGYSSGLSFGKKIAFLALVLGVLFLNAAFAQIEETVIATGDAQSDVTVENTVNTSETSVGKLEAEPPSGGSASSEEAAPTSERVGVENNNAAEVATEATSTAATGENSADNNSGSAVIATGDANASANIINIVNSTFTGSDGFIAFLNIFSSLFGDLDFRNSLFLNSTCPDCDIFSGDLSVNNQNTASIHNDAVVRAQTGGNSASGNAGAGVIATGDANAAANVFNVVNTNVVGSNYLLLVMNNFGSWNGDLVLPSKYLFPNCCSGAGSVSVNNNSDASIENNISGEAETGGNEANGNTNGLVVTGNANAVANTLNQVNTNIFGSDSVMIAFRFFGDWTGNVFSAPEGFSWIESDGGLVLMGDPSAGGFGGGAGSSTTINNSNFADIRNNVRVLALTGDNRASGNGGGGVIANGGGGVIATGNANAATNVVNVVNTNIFGRNWILALVNVFGNWNGNIAFGRPDLWVGESVSEIPKEAVPGDRITYTLTVLNNGDTDATNILLHDDFDERHLNPVSLNGGNRTDRGVEWNLGTLKPGEARVISYDVEIKDNLPAGATFLANTATAGSFEEDARSEDNTERTTILINRKRELNFSASALPDFKISKINGATSGRAKAGESVGYKIILKNDGGGLGYESKVTDKLYYATGTEPVDAREWPLDTVLDGELITITYTLQISPNAKPGIYKNVAKFSAKDEVGVDRYFVSAENFLEIFPAEPLEDPELVEGLPYELPAEESASQEPVSVEREIAEAVSLISDYIANPNEKKTEDAQFAEELPLAPENLELAEEPPRTPVFKNLLALAFLNFKWIWQWLATTAAGVLAALFLKFYG